MELKLIKELIGLIETQDGFFDAFDESCESDPGKKRVYEFYEEAFGALDEESRRVLFQKALCSYKDHRQGGHIQGLYKLGFFNHLNEAFAFKYLRERGYEDVRFVPKGKRRTPDIEYREGNQTYCCEVKTIAISDNQIRRRNNTAVVDGSIYCFLDEKFLEKFRSTVSGAREQIEEFSGVSRGIVFIVLNFDDFTHDYLENYKQQILEVIDWERLGTVEFYNVHVPVAVLHFG